MCWSEKTASPPQKCRFPARRSCRTAPNKQEKNTSSFLSENSEISPQERRRCGTLRVGSVPRLRRSHGSSSSNPGLTSVSNDWLFAKWGIENEEFMARGYVMVRSDGTIARRADHRDRLLNKFFGRLFIPQRIHWIHARSSQSWDHSKCQSDQQSDAKS